MDNVSTIENKETLRIIPMYNEICNNRIVETFRIMTGGVDFNESSSDQTHWSNLTQHNNYHLCDWDNHLYSEAIECKKQIDVVNKRVRINKNGKFRFPCAIHFPKKSYNEKIIRQLGYNFDSKNKIFKSSESYLIKNFFKHYSMYLYKYYILIIFLIIVYRLHRSK